MFPNQNPPIRAVPFARLDAHENRVANNINQAADIGQAAQAAGQLGAQILRGRPLQQPLAPNEPFLLGIPVVFAFRPMQDMQNVPLAPRAGQEPANVFMNVHQQMQIEEVHSPLSDSSDQTALPPGSR